MSDKFGLFRGGFGSGRFFVMSLSDRVGLLKLRSVSVRIRFLLATGRVGLVEATRPNAQL